MTNQGTKDAAANWTDAVYLSTKPTYDDTAAFVDYFNAPPTGSSPLAAGDSYTLNENVTLSGATTGPMYLLIVTNSNHNQSESDATNDVYALPITIGAPDLAVTAASAPASAALGGTIAVSWTTANQGGAAAPATWYDAVYVSSKSTFDNTATLLDSFYEGGRAGLAAGDSYVDSQNITLPATGLGQRYLLFVADAYDDQPETNESNNVFAVPIVLAAPDLAVSGATAPAAAATGQPDLGLVDRAKRRRGERPRAVGPTRSMSPAFRSSMARRSWRANSTKARKRAWRQGRITPKANPLRCPARRSASVICCS